MSPGYDKPISLNYINGFPLELIVLFNMWLHYILFVNGITQLMNSFIKKIKLWTHMALIHFMINYTIQNRFNYF